MNKRVTFVVPTYKEVQNLPLLINRIAQIAQSHDWEAELLIMDDDSQDGSDQAVAAIGLPWVNFITRKANRGLSQAVLEGFSRASGDYIVCLDADLSHPPEKVFELLGSLDEGADFVLGSRYVAGGTTDHDWGMFRWLNSRIATIMARPLTHLKDPMSGFFAIKREQFLGGRNFNPIGYKIGLELLVKCNCKKSVEIPIHFSDRRYGESKLTFKEQLRYVQHIRRLIIYKYGTWSHLIQFLSVGALGAVINIAVLTLALHMRLTKPTSIACGIFVSFLCNFVLNRRFTFSYARHRSIIHQFFGFTSASLLGAIVNYVVTLYCAVPHGPVQSPQVAALYGIIAGAGLNFLFNRYFVFKFEHYKPKDDHI